MSIIYDDLQIKGAFCGQLLSKSWGVRRFFPQWLSCSSGHRHENVHGKDGAHCATAEEPSCGEFMESKESGRQSMTQSVSPKAMGLNGTCHYWEVQNRALFIARAASLTPGPFGRVPHVTSSEWLFRGCWKAMHRRKGKLLTLGAFLEETTSPWHK